jgi:hypothetical protein
MPRTRWRRRASVSHTAPCRLKDLFRLGWQHCFANIMQSSETEVIQAEPSGFITPPTSTYHLGPAKTHEGKIYWNVLESGSTHPISRPQSRSRKKRKRSRNAPTTPARTFGIFAYTKRVQKSKKRATNWAAFVQQLDNQHEADRQTYKSIARSSALRRERRSNERQSSERQTSERPQDESELGCSDSEGKSDSDESTHDASEQISPPETRVLKRCSFWKKRGVPAQLQKRR